MKHNFLNNPGIRFIIRFVPLFLLFYFFHVLYIGITAPGGYYSPFLDQYLDYTSWLRKSLLHGGRVIAHIIGLDTIVEGPYNLTIKGGRSVRMVHSCLGYGVLSFWAAFVIANEGTFKKKLLWTLGGLASIWLINCLRIALLLLALHNHGNINRFAEHHTLFNIAAYTLVVIMMWMYGRRRERVSGE